jgi:transposase InsO family protein
VIRTEAFGGKGMPTSRFVRRLGVPERTYRRWQARHRTSRPVKGPWPAPVTETVEAYVVKHAEAHPAWGHRKIWALCRFDGHQVSPSTVERILRRRGLLQPRDHTGEVRQLAQARRAAFCEPPSGPNQVWQLDFTEVETTTGGTWRIAGCADYWAKYEFGWHLATTQNAGDAIAAVRLAITEAKALLGLDLLDAVTDRDTGEIHTIKVVTDNGPAFKAAAFSRFIAGHPELAHIRTRKKSPNTNGVRERGFGSLKYERLYRHELDDGLVLAEHAEAYRAEFNTTRPHEGISFNRPLDVYLGRARPDQPSFPTPKSLPPS